MGDSSKNQGKVLVISPAESFLSRSVVSKIEAGGFAASLFQGKINDIDKQRDTIELMVLFMNEGIEEMTEMLVYLKDMASDMDRKNLIICGVKG